MTVIGISGIGSIGARHARVFRAIPGVRVIAHDPFADQQQILERIGSDVSVVGTFSELLDLGTDGVVLASPESAHVDQVLAATSRHLPVLVEKPIAATLPDAARLLPALPAPVLVGYVLRHYRCMISAAAMLRAGSVGTPVSFHVDLGAYETLVVARNRFEHAPAGTIYADYSHEWDYLRWWFGEIAAGCAVEQTVTSVPLVQRPNVVDALLRLAGGVTGTVHLDYLQDPGHRRITVVGDAGRLTIDAGTGMVSRSARGSTQPETIDRGEPRDHAFAAQAAHFLAVARGETEPLVGVADGIAALATAVALRRSAATGSWQEVPPAATVTGPSILRPPAG